MKYSLKLFAISLLAAFALLATSIYQPPRADTKPTALIAEPTTCGAAVNGHTAAGGLPPTTCPDNGTPVFDETCHVYSDRDICPLDGLPLFYGHVTPGGH